MIALFLGPGTGGSRMLQLNARNVENSLSPRPHVPSISGFRPLPSV